MSASSNTSEKSKTHCDAVKIQRNIFSLSTTSILHNSASSNLNVIKAVNNGAKLNSQQDQQQSQRHRLQQQRQQQNHQLKQKQEFEAANKQDSSVNFQIESQKLSSDVQKVLKQEQELQKQLYSGSNVAPGWLRVNHNNKVIYISPSGIGLASLKQVKNYLLTRGTCKCGLPFPLRVELFFNFSTEVQTVPLKTPIDSIKFDPTCQHRKRLATNQQQQQQQHNQQTTAPKQTDVKRFKFNDNNVKQRNTEECLLPSYVTSATSRITSKTNLSPRNTVMILNNNNNNNNNNATLVTPSTHSQSQIVQTKQPQVALHQQRTHIQQPHFLQHDTTMMGTNVVMRVVKDDGVDSDGAKLPPWRKNSIIQQTQIVKNIHQQPQQQSTTQMVSQAVPIFQINGQNVIAIDQNNQQYHVQQPQQFQIIEQKGDGTETWLTTTDGKYGKTILRRRPTFKEDPTGYLNQQTALLQNSITTLHSPNENQSGAKGQDTSNEKRQFIQQIVKTTSTPSQQVTTTIGGQTVTHMPNGVVQIQQNCDIKQATKPILIQDPVQISPSKIIRQNPKGRPPKNPQTIAKRLVAMSQESPVSSTSNVRIVKSNTPDISSSSQFPDGMSETQIIQSENSEIMKMTTKELMRTSVTQVKTITSPTTTVTSGMTTILKKPTMTMLKKPTTTTMINPIKSPNAVTGQQIMMTSNGQQFIVMPQQQQPQNIMLNNNGIVQFQNTNNTNQRIIQTATGQNGNFLIQSGGGNMLTTAGNPGGNFILSNGQQLNPVFIQNGQIIQSPNMLSPKGNILLSSGSGNKTVIAGNNQPMIGQQTVLLNGHQVMLPTQTFLQDSSLIQNSQSQNNSIASTPEKKKGRKRKIPLPEVQQPIQTATTTIQAPQQQNLIQGFQIAQPNVIKIPQQQHSPQFILQNGQTLIQQPLNLLNGQQLMLQPGSLPVMISPDGGNSIVQLQNPTFNNIIQTPQGMMIRAPIQQHQQQQQQMQKTIITNNGQQFIVNQAGMNQVFNSPMGFIVQAQQNQQQQIINAGQQPIMMQTQAHGQHILAQPQIINQTPTSMSQGTMIGQQTQYFTQSDGKVRSQRKIIHQKVQQQKFFPQMSKPPRVAQTQTFVQEIELNEEDDGENQEDEEQEENVEDMEQEEQEISFDDDKQELIQELHHGQQQVLHHSMTGDGQCGIMNIDDITIEMDEINDLNEYLNAIDEEDNRMTQIGLSSLQQQFANSPPDTTTHSPRSPVHLSSDKSNGSSDSTNMVQFVSSSEQDCISNVVSPEGVDSPSNHQTIYINNSQGTFKQPEPKSSSMTSPRSTTPMSPMPQTMHMIMNDRSQSSPSMRPDSHESASSSSYHRSETPTNDDNESPRKSDFDLLKESPPVNTIKPIAPEGLIDSDDSNSNPLPTTNKVNTIFTVGDLIWGAARGCDAWPGKVVNGPDGEPTSSDCVWVKWFGGRQNTEMVLCSTLKSLSEGLEAHHAAQKDSRKGRKLNSHLERAIQKAMSELDKQSNKKSNERKNVTKSSKSKSIKITTATDRK